MASIGLFLGYLPSAAAFAYIVSFMFSKSGVALFASWIFYMLFGVLASTVIMMLNIFASELEGALTAAAWLRSGGEVYTYRWRTTLLDTPPLGSEGACSPSGGLAALGLGGPADGNGTLGNPGIQRGRF